MNLINIVSHIFLPVSADKEWSELGDDIASLARDTLTAPEYNEAEHLTQEIVSGGIRKQLAIKNLQNKIGTTPKRPIYYVTMLYLPRLPYHTREIVRYLGDYLDELIKYFVRENHRSLFYIPRSMGTNIKYLKSVVSIDLQEQLKRYNKNIYVPAKHDFEVHNRNHRFTCREAVLTIAITLKLATNLKNISLLSHQYAENKQIYMDNK